MMPRCKGHSYTYIYPRSFRYDHYYNRKALTIKVWLLSLAECKTYVNRQRWVLETIESAKFEVEGYRRFRVVLYRMEEKKKTKK
jgi:hypothetical protein